MSLKSLLKFFEVADEDEYENYDEYDNYEEEPEEPVRKKAPVRNRVENDYEEEAPRQRSSFLGSKPKVVSMNRNMLEVNIIKPTSFEDSQEICNMLLSGKPVIVNLEGFDPDDAQRIMDFITGCIYSINGKYQQISKYIFIFSPENVDISGDSLSMEGSTAKMPTLNREF